MGDVGHGSRHPLQHAPELWVWVRVLGASQISDVWVHEEQCCPGSPVHAQSPCCASRKKKRLDQKLSRYNLLTFRWTLLNIQDTQKVTSDEHQTLQTKKKGSVTCKKFQSFAPTTNAARCHVPRLLQWNGNRPPPFPFPPHQREWELSGLTDKLTHTGWLGRSGSGWMSFTVAGYGGGRSLAETNTTALYLKDWKGLERARPHTLGVGAGLLPASLWCPKMLMVHFRSKPHFPPPSYLYFLVSVYKSCCELLRVIGAGFCCPLSGITLFRMWSSRGPPNS